MTLNLTYHPAFLQLKKILQEIHILLTPDLEHRNVFDQVPIVGFKKGRSLKDILVRAKLPNVEKSEGGCGPCGSEKCRVCNVIKTTDHFSDADGRSYQIRSNTRLNCNSKLIVYLVQCKKCNIQYVGSAKTMFRDRLNNYKSMHRNFVANKPVTQRSFHAHFNSNGHEGMSDWSFSLIDQADSFQSVRRKESFWQYQLNTFAPKGLNERDVVFEYG